MQGIHNNGYGFGTLFSPQGTGIGHLMGNGHSPFKTRGNEDRSDAFAADIVSHINTAITDAAEQSDSTSASTNGSTNGTDSAQSNPSQQDAKDTSGLAQALSDTIDYVDEKYGKHAAAAVMGLIKSKTGEGEVTEENLSDGLLASIKFIDQKFGIEEGDNFIDQLNGSLNEEMNALFDNGLNERFFAASSGYDSVSSSFSSALGKVADQFGQDAADGIMSMIESMVETGTNPEDALKEGIKKAEEYLKSEDEGNTLAAAMVQNGGGFPTGSILNISV